MGVQLENNLSEEKNERAFYEPYPEKKQEKAWSLSLIWDRSTGTRDRFLYSIFRVLKPAPRQMKGTKVRAQCAKRRTRPQGAALLGLIVVRECVLSTYQERERERGCKVHVHCWVCTCIVLCAVLPSVRY